MIAALEPLRAQKACDLVGAGGQGREGELCLLVAGIDDPERRAVPAVSVAGEFPVEPVERPVERNGVWPAKPLHGRIVIGAVFEQKGARVLEGRHVVNLSTCLATVATVIPAQALCACRWRSRVYAASRRMGHTHRLYHPSRLAVARTSSDNGEAVAPG